MAIMLIFAIATVFTGWQLWNTRSDVKSLSTDIERVRQGIYNSDGWSVLNGTMMNEWIYSQKHPETYQKYLEQKSAEK